MSTVFDEAILEDHAEIDLSVLPSMQREREPVVVLSLDIGTSGMRAALFNERGDQIEGSFVALANEEFPALVSGDDVDPENLVASVAALLDRAVERAEQFVSRVDYVAASCFWHSLIGINQSGKAVTPLLGWADQRGAGAVAELRKTLNEAETHARTGCRFHSSYWPAKLLWLKESSTDLFTNLRRWVSFSDYLYAEFFGSLSTSVSMASATGMLNQATCEWDDELIAILGIRKDQLPPIAPLRKTAGGMRDDYMLRWPLLARASWLLAIGDGAANNVGAGCVSRNQIALMLGTSGAVRMVSAREAPVTLPGELFCYRVDRERVVLGGALSDGGGLFSWLQNNLALNYTSGELNLLLDSCEPDAHGLTILPFWSGERAPNWSTGAAGTIHGLTAATKSLDLARAAIESICYLFARILQPLDSFAPDAAIVLTGKIFLSFPVWAQILSDVFGRKVELSPVAESSLRGAALLALETIGTIDTLETFSSEAGRIFVPDLQRHEVYRQAMQRQQDFYRRIVT